MPERSPWGIGVAAAVSDSPYVGEGTRVIPVPLLSYEGERFYFRGITAGWRLVDTPGFELAVLGKARLERGTDSSASMFIGVSRGFRPWWMRGR